MIGDDKEVPIQEQGVALLESNETMPPPESSVLRIFISYRSDPDAPVASALKRLIEGAIEPQPVVFVAGEGGLRPSNIGFKRQLQTAAQSAHAFVAVITNSSKDREWIFFEAGAAWGRDLMYAPVLLGPRPEDLPGTIGDYQALKALSKEDMLRLLVSLAERVGAEVRDRFGQRYQAFARTVEQHLQGTSEAEGGEDSDRDFFRAYRLATQGDVEQSNEIFERMEAKAKDAEEKAHLRIFRIRAQKKPQELRTSLENLGDEFKATTAYNYNMAIETERPGMKADYLQRAIQIGGGRTAKLARLEHARLDFQLGEDKRASQELMSIIEQDRAGELSEQAARSLVELTQTFRPLEQLLIYLAGLSGALAAGYRWISDLAGENFWNALNIYCSKRVDSLEETGASANSLGIARERAGLPALAFEAYSRGSLRGVSVARCNMARLVNGAGAPMAALVLLNEHQGPFDAADPGYPHELKAQLERALQAERDREKEISSIGEKQLYALWAFSERALSGRKAPVSRPKGQLLCGSRMLAIDELSLPTIPPDDHGFRSIRSFGENVFSAEEEKRVVLICVTTQGAIEGLSFEDFSAGNGVNRCTWVSQEASASTMAATDPKT